LQNALNGKNIAINWQKDKITYTDTFILMQRECKINYLNILKVLHSLGFRRQPFNKTVTFYTA